MGLSDAHHSRKMVAGACMMLAPVVLLVSTIVRPELHDGAAAQLAEIGANRDAWYIATLIGLFSIILAVPAVLGLMHMLREKHVTEGHVGGGLALMGLLAFTGATAIAMVAWQMVGAGAPGPMVALFDRVQDTAGIYIPFYLGGFLFSAGIAVMAYGLLAARAVSPISAAFLVAGAVLVPLGFALSLAWMTIVAAALLCVGLCPIGYLVWSESDTAWEHTPEFTGFRPAAGTS